MKEGTKGRVQLTHFPETTASMIRRFCVCCNVLTVDTWYATMLKLSLGGLTRTTRAQLLRCRREPCRPPPDTRIKTRQRGWRLAVRVASGFDRGQ